MELTHLGENYWTQAETRIIRPSSQTPGWCERRNYSTPLGLKSSLLMATQTFDLTNWLTVPPMFDPSTSRDKPPFRSVVTAGRWSGVRLSEVGHEAGLKCLLRTVWSPLAAEGHGLWHLAWLAGGAQRGASAGRRRAHVPAGQAPQW